MQKVFYGLVLITGIIAGCSDGKKAREGDVNDKRVRLEKLKKEQQNLNAEIEKLQKELALTDTTGRVAANPKLVAVAPVQPQDFTHYIDLQGKIDATNISYVAPPNGMGGVVKALYIKQGDYVRKGQVLAKLDDQLLRQQIEPVRVQLAAAEDTYRRTKNLWDQGIGTYQQVLTAQTQVESLRKQIGIIQKQIGQTNVTAPTSGVADQVNVRVGEAFVGQTALGPQIRIVNTGSLKVVTEVPENYLGRVGQGSKVQIVLPNINRTLESRVNVAGKTIDPARRTFYIEAPIPSEPNLKPNQIATVRIQDYAVASAVTIPVNTLQNDDKGKFVMVAVNENGKMIARKRYVTVGELYQDRLEVKSGLQNSEQLITEGFQNLYDGQLITTA
ncbi:MAG: efflux RND transporter periplasmic adaptor subunit [Bacteroidota bacterium]|nr:efflux RND transporter periplasmic adaptor subunit [Flavisolibacter sp.]MBD0350862.1 efflux RND transporter periplasmic adaptor subunit [Flavisolibacter sp.]MDQ3844174.1 efflux RND transporter periplasmic adaptor subunit [Bacteroidota bacterium]